MQKKDSAARSEEALLNELSRLIEQSQHQLVSQANSTLTGFSGILANA